MTKEQIAELEQAATAAAIEAEEAGGEDEELNKARDEAQTALDNAKAEAAKAPPQEPKKRTPLEKALYARQKIDEEIAKLKGSSEEDEPLTMGKLKEIEAEKAKQSALSLAESIEDEELRTEVASHLENTIRLSGNPEQDFQNALRLVDSEKKAQVIEELQRKGVARTHSSASGAPGKVEGTFEPTPQEAIMMAPPYNLTKEEVLKAREKSQ